MASYDLKRLEVAIQYIRRMSDGKNPVTNRPAPENEVQKRRNRRHGLAACPQTVCLRDLPL